ncbi:MAG: Ig-like domain-containing protein [Thermoguttaceae bacterium]
MEDRAAPGGGILEILLGLPPLSPFRGSYWADTLLGDEEVPPEITWRSKDRLSALAGLPDEAEPFASVLSVVRTLAHRASGSQEVADWYAQVARARIEKVAEALSDPKADLGSRDFLVDLWWVDELFTSLARARGIASATLNSAPLLDSDGAASMDYGLDNYGGYGGPPNMPPVANDDGPYSVVHDQTLNVPPQGSVLLNDGDPNGDPITLVDGDPSVPGIQPVSGPAHGSAELHADGTFSYTPAYHYTGYDQFNYRIRDPQGLWDDATVRLYVHNSTPYAGYDQYTTRHDTLLEVSAPGVLGNDSDPDGDPLTAVLMAGPSHATSFTFNADGSFSYLPAEHYIGSDSFSYRATDGMANSPTTIVYLVNRNEPPIFDPVQEGQWESPDIAPPEPWFMQGQFVGQLHATDPDGDTIGYSMEDVNGYLSLNAESGVITVAVPEGLQNALQSGDLTIPVFASDGVASDSSFCKLGISPSEWLAGPSIIVLRTKGGCIYNPTTAAELIEHLEQMRSRGDRINELLIKGHGWFDGIKVGNAGGEWDDYLTCEGGIIRIGDRDVTDLLVAVTDGHSKITLRGCFSYWLAGRVGSLLGVKAYGQVFFRLSIPGTTW